MALLLFGAIVVVITGFGVLCGRQRRRPEQAVPAGLRAVVVRTRSWRWGGLLLGLLMAGESLRSGTLGRGPLLAAPLLALGVLLGVVVGELRVTAPGGSLRRAPLEVRRVSDYLPRRLSRIVLMAATALVAVAASTTAAGSADDLGRAGRTLARRCSPERGEASGPWPGSFYVLPLAAVIVVGVVVTALALRAVIRRPRQGHDPLADDVLRSASAQAVVAACGLLVAVPFAGICVTAGSGLLAISCRPAWWTVAGCGLLALVPLWLALGAWCAGLLTARAPYRAEQRPVPVP